MHDESLEQKNCQCDLDTVINGIVHEVGSEEIIKIHIEHYRSWYKTWFYTKYNEKTASLVVTKWQFYPLGTTALVVVTVD